MGTRKTACQLNVEQSGGGAAASVLICKLSSRGAAAPSLLNNAIVYLLVADV